MKRVGLPKGKKPSLTIGWLYPELMSTYGDRGNVIVLTKRAEWRGIGVTVFPIDFSAGERGIAGCDIILGGGAQDRQQGILVADLREKKGGALKALFERGVPGLFVCGSPQLLGHWYMTGEGEKLDGLGIFDMVSRHFGTSKPRCIGNLVADVGDRFKIPGLPYRSTIVGFENHGGRTYLADGVEPLGKVLTGFGNNGEDGFEGAVWKHCIATYSHGPFLSKNPHAADWLIATALAVKYGKAIPLAPLDDTLEWQAHDAMVSRLLHPTRNVA